MKKLSTLLLGLAAGSTAFAAAPVFKENPFSKAANPFTVALGLGTHAQLTAAYRINHILGIEAGAHHTLSLFKEGLCR